MKLGLGEKSHVEALLLKDAGNYSRAEGGVVNISVPAYIYKINFCPAPLFDVLGGYG